MRFAREQTGAVAVRAIGDNTIRIGSTVYDKPVVVTAERVLGEWPPTPIADLDAGHFDELMALEPEVIVLGTGPAGQFAPRELVFAMARRTIGFEVMDTAAAARTFNVLAGEGRNVAAVFYPP